MIGLAADHGAQRNEAVIVDTPLLRRIERKGNRGRNLERARHRDNIVGRAGLVERRLGAVEQRVGEVVVEASLDDQQFECIGHICLQVAVT
jgi:hypothetical protein